MADDRITDLLDTFGDPNYPDPLHPDLLPYVEEDGTFGATLRHPLVYHVPFAPALHRMANRQYETKRKAVKEALAEHNWVSYIYLHERPWRLDAFKDITKHLTDKEYWDLLSDIWTDTENYWQNAAEWQEFFSSARPWRKYLMTTEERNHLRSLPNPVTVYRGFSVDEAEKGLSWTTSLNKAYWFAQRLTKDGEVPRIATMTVDKDQIIAYKNERGEDEVIILPESLGEISIEEVP